MNIKKLSLLTMALLICSGNALASGFWSVDFNSGIPKSFTVLDRDGVELIKENYSNVATNEGWVAGRTEEYGYSAMSLSNTDNEIGQDNWLITEPIELIGDNPYLRWEARTILKHRPESYHVMISTTDANPESFVEIDNINAESNEWHTHLTSLADYKGKTIYLAFVCYSNNKFILAIDNISVGDIDDHNIIVNDNTPKFCGNVETINVNGYIINAGKTYALKDLCITYNFEGETDEQILKSEVASTFNINDKLEYSFDIPVEVGKNTEYTIWGETVNGESVEIFSDYVICSYFKRKMLVEKATGTWCNSCPDGTAYMHFLKERYKDELIYVSVHIRDIMECNYQKGLSQWVTQVPLIIINRLDDGGVLGATQFKKSGKFNYEPFYEIAKHPTYVGLNAEAEIIDNYVKIHADVEFAKDYDNISDIYRMCYAIYENKVENPNNTGYNQVNNCNFNTLSQEFYYLPSKIPASLMAYDNVAREGSLSKSGVEKSFDATILAGDKISFDYELTIPESVVDKNNISVVTYVMNTKTAEILNADVVNLSKKDSSVSVIENTSDLNLSIWGNICHISFDDMVTPYSLQVISLDGRIIKSVNNVSPETNKIDFVGIEGFAIIKLIQGSNSKVVKVMI